MQQNFCVGKVGAFNKFVECSKASGWAQINMWSNGRQSSSDGTMDIKWQSKKIVVLGNENKTTIIVTMATS